jgi:hypothetical protein
MAPSPGGSREFLSSRGAGKGSQANGQDLRDARLVGCAPLDEYSLVDDNAFLSQFGRHAKSGGVGGGEADT